MAALLSDEWFALVRDHGAELPVTPGASLVMQHVVTGAPQGKVQAVVEMRDGQVVAADLGKTADASCTVTWTYKDAVAAIQGELGIDEAFMRGDLKIEGDYVTFLFGLRPALANPAASAVLEKVRAGTDT